MSEPRTTSDPAVFGRLLARGCTRAALATSLNGAPYASLVLFAVDVDASPLLLLSDLAQHSRNIAFDPRVSLLLDATEGHPDPLTGPRLTLLGRALPTDDPRCLARFVCAPPVERWLRRLSRLPSLSGGGRARPSRRRLRPDRVDRWRRFSVCTRRQRACCGRVRDFETYERRPQRRDCVITRAVCSVAAARAGG